MISRIFVYPEVQARRLEGVLGDFVDGFVAAQLDRGYGLASLRSQARLVADLSRWLARRRLRASDLDESRIVEFVRHRKRRGLRRSQADVLAALVAHLRAAGVVGAVPMEAPSQQQCLEREYDEYLRQVRRVSPGTRRNYLRVARGLVAETRVASAAQLTAKDITAYVCRHARRHPRSAQFVTGGLRSFLRYLYVREVLSVDMSAAVPAVASRRFEHLPAFLSLVEVKRLLAAASPRAGGCLRDRAMLLLLVRLGLRAGEVASLGLDDVDWRRGEIVLRGKTGRHTLPLPPDVGESLALYLRQERPACQTRCLFVRRRAPHVPFAHAASVSCMVDRALRRAGLQPRHRGAHLLRHTAATQMLRHAATLAEIGDVLGHRSMDTTAIYAHVDVTALRRVALPWPHGGR
jgi:site-specific recombinase XerD